VPFGCGAILWLLALLLAQAGKKYPTLAVNGAYKTVFLIASIAFASNLVLSPPVAFGSQLVFGVALNPSYIFWFVVVSFSVVVFRLHGYYLSKQKAAVALAIALFNGVFLTGVQQLFLWLIATR
jgi:hypothetical protein